MAALTTINPTKQFTIQSDDATKDIGSIFEVQVKNFLFNELATNSMRSTMTAESIINMGGVATAIYRLPQRINMGTDYDFEKGAVVQRTRSSAATLKIDQHITITVMFEDFDMKRYMESPIDVRGALLSSWTESFTKSYIMTMEGIWIRSQVDYVTAQAPNRPQNVFKLDPKDITSPEIARNVYQQIKTLVLNYTKLVDANAIGIKEQDIMVHVSLDLYVALVTWLPSLVLNETTFRILATGELLDNRIFGIPSEKHFMLQNKFMKAQPSAINKDLDFDFSNISVIIAHKDAVAQPISFEFTMSLIDNQTGNPKIISKNMGSIPEILRGNYVAVGFLTVPDNAAITAAQGRIYNSSTTTNDYKQTFQLSEWDIPLKTPETELIFKDFSKDGIPELTKIETIENTDNLKAADITKLIKELNKSNIDQFKEIFGLAKKASKQESEPKKTEK